MLKLRLLLPIALIAVSVSAAQVFNARSNDIGRKEPNSPANCLMQSLTMDCNLDLDRGVPSVCTATYKNNGAGLCIGHITGVAGVVTQGTADQGFSTGPIATTCHAVGLTALPLADQSGVPSLESAIVCDGDGIIGVGETMAFTARITPAVNATSPYKVGSSMVFKDADTTSTSVIIGTGTFAQCNLVLSAPALTQSGAPYSVTWSAAASSTTYELQEATQPDFSDAKTQTTSSVTQQFTHTATGSPATYYYRVRATSCRGSLGPYSSPAQVIINPALDAASKSFDLVVPVGSTTVVVQQVRFDGLTPNSGYTATVDKPYLTVVPSPGRVGADGVVNLTVRADPTTLGVGANTGTVTITAGLPKTGGRVVSLDSNTKSTTVSVSLVTPVTSAPKSPPPASALIVPAVAHTNGIGAQFVSDVRLANVNTSGITTSYQLTFTATNTDGTKSGQQTKLDLAPGQTAALNDVLHDFFGLATSGANASGVLEIRTLTNAATGTFAASRIYSNATSGTYGQFIPSVPVDRVAAAPATGTSAVPLILSHIGQTAASRMNLGLVEALGFATTGHIRTFSAGGQLLSDVPFSLRPFEQQQINSFLARNGISTTNSHIEVVVDAPAAGTTSGAVTSYVSLLDNSTQDASVMTGIKASSLSSKRYTLPGVSEASSSGDHSEVRILNAGTSAVDTTLTFYPEGSGSTPVVRNVSLAAGEVKNFDGIVASLFGRTSGRGSLVVTTQNEAPLLITSRTYSAASQGGTYGQFQTAVTSTDGIGSGEGDLQLLQLEESDKFHTDVGIAELTGNPVKVQVTLIPPDAKASVSGTIDLDANGFLLSSIASLAGGNVYNARVSVKVISGSGRVAAYGSLVDKATNDPTLVPAQK